MPCESDEGGCQPIEEAGEIVTDQNEQVTNEGRVISAKNGSRFQKILEKMKAVFGQHQEAVTDLEGALKEMTEGSNEVNGDYHSTLPPTGATDQPAAFASGAKAVGNDMLHDAISQPPVGGMGTQTVMKQAEPSATPDAEKSAKEVDNMDDATKKNLTDMGYDTSDWNNFLAQVKALKDEKTALTDRIKGQDSEIANLKAQVEKFGKKLDQKKQKIENMKYQEFKNKLPKGLFPKTEEADVQLRKEWDEDRDAVTNKLLATVKGFKPKGQEGQTETPAAPVVDPVETIRNKKTRGIGLWDAYANEGKGGFVD